MSPAQAVFAGAVLIATSILFVNTLHPAVAGAGGPYQLMHHSNTAANAGVFRLDITTGDVSYCYLAGTASAELTCTKSVR